MNLILWMRQICGFLILSSILKNLLAQRRYSPYIKLFMNLLLVLLLVQPLMRIDLESLDGSWKEVSADAGNGNWRQQLAVLAGYGQDIKYTQKIISMQIESLAAQKGYQLEEIEIAYDEEGEEVRQINLVFSELDGYIREPVIWSEGSSYTGNESSSVIKRYLEEILKPADGVELNVMVR